MGGKHRVVLLMTLSVIMLASVAIVLSLFVVGRAGGSEEIYRSRYREWERLTQEAVELRLAIRRGAATPANMERLGRIDAECDALFRWCRKWEIAHGDQSPVRDAERARRETADEGS